MRAPSRTLRLPCAGLAIAAALGAASPCWASDSLAALLACRGIQASAARLACFDRESAALAAQPAPAAARALDPRATFGLAPMTVAARAEAAAHAPKALDSLPVRIAAVSKAADGREIFTLDNHQVWVQLLADGTWLDARPGEQAQITRGWLGSYWLHLSSGRGFKVTRVR
jgi:hypothetical protein